MSREFAEKNIRIYSTEVVSVDETYFEVGEVSHQARSKKGTRAFVTHKGRRAGKISMAVGMTVEGYVFRRELQEYVDEIEDEEEARNVKGFNSEIFAKFLRDLFRNITFVSPHANKYVFYMDNAPFHHSAPVKQFAEEYKDRVVLMYNAPYSPQLNPIEYLFGWIKSFVKRKEYLCMRKLRKFVHEVMNRCTAELCISWFDHSQRLLIEIAANREPLLVC